MKTILSSLVFLVLISPALAQTTVKGSLLDRNNKPLSFASVALLNAHDSSQIKGSLSSEQGTYLFDQVMPGQYRVHVSMVGFEPLKSAVVTVADAPLQVPALTLTEAARKLNEVTVIAQKPLYEQQIDRMVINVQSSITNAGATALDVLERAPGVIVDRQNNTVAMNGKSGVMVMLNGRLARLPLEAVMQMLSGMQASNIDKIELITTPPAQYDAEGNAGLINIVTKKNVNLGTNGSYSANFGYGRKGRMGASANVNHKTEKASLYADYSATRNDYMLLGITTRTITHTRPLQTTVTYDRSLVDWIHNGRVGLDYQLSHRTTVSGLATAYSYHSQQFAQNTSNTFQGNVPVIRGITLDNELNYSQIYTGALSARHTFGPGQELSADVEHIYFLNKNPHHYQFTSDYPQEMRTETERLHNEKQTPVRVWVAKADYTRSFTPKVKLELGVKGAFSNFDNNVQAERFINGEWQGDSIFSQHVLMHETIGAAYVNLTDQVSSKTKIQAGLRYEHTLTDLRTFAELPLLHRNYGNWFPTFFVSHELTSRSSIQFSYSRRITRPSFTNLAPFFTILTPDMTIGGNDHLLPAISNNFQTTYRFLKNVLLTLDYTRYQDAIAFITTVIPGQNRQISRPENLDRLTVSSVGLNFPVQVSPAWRMQTNLQAIRFASRLIQDGIALERSQQFVRLNSTQTVRLPNDFTVEATGLYQSRGLNGIAVRKAFGSLTIGIQKKLKHDAGTLRLTGEDVFWTNINQFSIDSPELGYSVISEIKLTNRLVRLTFTRNFGNQKVKVNSRVIGSPEDRQRVNN